MKKAIILSVSLLFSAVTTVYRPTLNNEKNIGVKVISFNSWEENLNVNMLGNITVATVAFAIITQNVVVSEPAISEGMNVSTASNSLYKFKENGFKSILNDIEMRKLDNTKN